MPVPEPLLPFWRRFVASVASVDDSRFYEAFAFGDSPQLADELADLVLRGVKRATAGSLWAFDADGRQPPRPGDLSIVTDSAGAPVCVIETLAVDIVPFDQVDGAFAAAEGEGDGSLVFWRDAHTRYFGRECARLGRVFSPSMPVACERFSVVYPPSASAS